MPGEIDFGALRTPDYFGNALKYREEGQRAGALSRFGTDPQGSIDQLAAVDPETAANLQRLTSSRAASAARAQAATQYSSGDKAGARSTALAAGDAETLAALDKLDASQAAEAKNRAENMYAALSDVQSLPYEQRKAKLAEIAPHAAQFGLKPEDVLSYDPTDDNNRGLIIKALGMSAYLERKDKLSKPIEIDPTKNIYMPEDGSAPPAAAPAAPAPQPAAAPDQVWAAMKHREVQNGDGNAVSPQGAIGSTQMLPATAQQMAGKVGLPWRPDMMRGNSPQALAYQDALGKAYFQEGLQKYNGDLYKAASYYHGGPDERQWGPKTRAYAEAVTGGAQGDAQPYQVAANGATPPPPSIPGYRMVQQGRRQWQPDGKGVLVNTATGDRKADPAYEGGHPTVRPATAEEKAAHQIPADVPAQIDTKTGKIDVISGLGARAKPPPAAIVSGYTSNKAAIAQIDAAMAAVRKNPHALGLKNYMGDAVNQRLDPKGVETRAAVTNIGSKVLHDRSGAAVTAAESPRLMPFIPQPTDTADAAIKKLEGLKEQYINSNTEMEVAYGADQGYAPLGGSPAPRPAAAPAPRASAPKNQPQQAASPASAIAQARDAIRRGAPREAVIKRLRDHGINPAGI